MAIPPRLSRRRRLPLVAVLVCALVALGSPGPAQAARTLQVDDRLLSGTVTGAGQVLANVWVTLTPVSAIGRPTGAPLRILTDVSGRYEFGAVPFANAKLHVRAPLFGSLVDTFWPAAYSMAAAGNLELTSREVVADVDLPHGGSVSGVVVDSVSGAPVPGALVSATIRGTPSAGFYGAAEPVEEAGQFAISGLPPVPILLLVRLPQGSSHLAPTYGGGSSPEDLRVDGATSTTGLAVRVGRGAEIRGAVRDETGAPVPGAEVGVTQCRRGCPRPVVSDDSGAYRITAIPPGSGVRVFAWGGPESRRRQRNTDATDAAQTGLLPQWHSGRGSEHDATPVKLRAGEVRTIDFQLTRGAFVTVEVRGSLAGEPLTEVITLLRPVANPYQRQFAQRIPGDPGRQLIGPVAPGAYTLRVNPGTANPGYLPVAEFVDDRVAPKGIITIAAGDRIEISVRLQAVPGATPRVAPPGAAVPAAGASGAPPGPSAGPGAGRSW